MNNSPFRKIASLIFASILFLVINTCPNLVTLCASEATPNREGKPSILSEEHPCQKARATRRVNNTLNAYSIVFVHIGTELPPHLEVTIAQARLFNEACAIYLIANEVALTKAPPSLIENETTFVSCESLKPSIYHSQFRSSRSHDWSFYGLWVYSSERFFFIEELIRQFQLTNVFHLESDVMLYADLATLLPVFSDNYQGKIGAIFENDRRCVPSFIYFSALAPIEELVKFYPSTVSMTLADMDILALFKDRYHKILIDHLPIVASEYANDHTLVGLSIVSQEPDVYSNHIDDFNAIFDGAAWGIYLAGYDSRFFREKGFGTISDYCVFNPSFFSFTWKTDPKGRRIPMISYKGNQLPLINLHITNKSKIKRFSSLSF